MNGKFIQEKVCNVEELDQKIEEDLLHQTSEVNETRESGKKRKYALGTIVKYNEEYLLTALTKFDDNNNAYLTLEDYIIFLIHFWKNLNKIFQNNNVAITLFGSNSLIRFQETSTVTDQDLIDIILWTFKLSTIKFKYEKNISLVLPKNVMKKINLYKIEEMYKNGI